MPHPQQQRSFLEDSKPERQRAIFAERSVKGKQSQFFNLKHRFSFSFEKDFQPGDSPGKIESKGRKASGSGTGICTT